MTHKTFPALLLLLVGIAAAAGCGQIEIDARPLADAGAASLGGRPLDTTEGSADARALGSEGLGGDGQAGGAGEPSVAGMGGLGVACLPPGEETWSGCVPGQPCGVCKDMLGGYVLYEARHPRCAATNDACDRNGHGDCSIDCPPPSEADQCNGTPSNWDGCRGNGCWVCADLVAGCSRYFKHHGHCVVNTTCDGLHYQCSAACPPPTEADR